MSSPSLIFTPDGMGRGLYTELVDLGRIGRLSIGRATRIEFDNDSGQWRVYPTDSEEVLHANASRAECVAWEHAYIEKLEDERHEGE